MPVNPGSCSVPQVDSGRSPIRLLPLVLCVVAAFLGCSKDYPAVVGLLDQIPELEPAGPWRVVVDVPNILDELMSGSSIAAVGLRLGERGMVGQGSTVELSFSVRVEDGEMLVCTFGRQHPADADEQVTVVLSGMDDSTKTSIAPMKVTQFHLGAPRGGADMLAVRFSLAEGRVLPISSLRVLAVAPGTDHREVQRATALNSVASQDGWGVPNGMVMFGRFPLQRGGVTRECVALVGTDTSQLRLPGGRGWSELRFWTAALRGAPKVRVEIRSRGQWHEAGYHTGDTDPGLPWRDSALDRPIRSGSDSIRFVSMGDPQDLVVIGEPRLVTRSRGPSRKPNLILIDLDTMRADRLGCYGYKTRPTSARLDSMMDAKGFFLFSRAYSAGPHTLPATAKFMTSRYLNIHRSQTVPRDYTTLAEVLRSNDFYCAAFTSGGRLRCPGFEQGFHEYHYTPRGDAKVEEVFPAVHRWLADDHPTPFFLFVHTYESHGPYTRDRFCKGLPHGRLGDLSKGEELLPGGSGQWSGLSPAESLYVQAAYDGGVAKACEATAELFQLLDRLDLWSRTAVVILSDHGEEFWEHSDNYATHAASSVYGELLNVPFLLYDPRFREEGLREEATPVSTVDLLPTVCDLLNIRVPVRCDGVSVRPLLEGKPLLRGVPILATNDESRAMTKRAALVLGTTKYIEPLGRGQISGRARMDSYSDDPALFFLDSDPGETDNRLLHAPQIARMMAESLHAALGRAERPIDVDAPTGGFSPAGELREQLRVLGYVEDR